MTGQGLGAGGRRPGAGADVPRILGVKSALSLARDRKELGVPQF